ncbi:MAG: hypothetical protein KGJ23_00900 [Euryarchaeota archaeon]|nr:hypothetical protein [Euryarchaeota archaeon]MDE1835154.1 hypothetical protein [Euryarchaeota archaeon]MDE1882022.1 hypothetical protein [Euryarchaeota archaeon]MDE2046197.1 hypothetical protein [Thermoplasmata archaeon]
MAFKERVRAFGKTPIGFGVYLAIIVLLSGFFVGELGIPVGALLMLLVAFGLPIYVGWKTSLRKMLAAALACLLFAPLVTGLVVTQVAVVPSPLAGSADNVLQNATVSPWESNHHGQVYKFQVDVSNHFLVKNITLKAVDLWISNCAYDTNSSQGACYLTPHEKFHNITYWLSPTQQNATWPFELTFNVSDLAPGEIYYFMFLTEVASVGAESVNIFGFNAHWGGWSCTVPGGAGSGYGGCSYTQGPITTDFGGVYALLLPDFYLSMLLLVAVLTAIILIYSYLKGRERMRLAKAKAAAAGESGEGGPPAEELRCPHCGAVVDKGESTCWKCKKSLSEVPEKTVSIRYEGGAEQSEGGPGVQPLPSGKAAPLPTGDSTTQSAADGAGPADRESP